MTSAGYAAVIVSPVAVVTAVAFVDRGGASTVQGTGGDSADG